MSATGTIDSLVTHMSFHEDPYARVADAKVVGITPEGGVVCDVSVFFPSGAGQPGDSGRLLWNGREIGIASATRLDGGDIALVPSSPASLPQIGMQVRQAIDWHRRYRHMRLHTALHLVSAALSAKVVDCRIGVDKGWITLHPSPFQVDFSMLERRVTDWIDADLPVRQEWRAQDDATLRSGGPKPRNRRTGQVRLITIGHDARCVDTQPCDGTHVARTAEIGAVVIDVRSSRDTHEIRVDVRLDD